MIGVPEHLRVPDDVRALAKRLVAGMDRTMSDFPHLTLIQALGVAQGVLAARLAWRPGEGTALGDSLAEAHEAAREALTQIMHTRAMAAGSAFLNRRSES